MPSSGNQGGVVFVGIAPHPPVMVPEVGRAESAQVSASVAAVAALAERVCASGAETLVLISPHAPLDERAFVAYDDAMVCGDFRTFRAPEVRVRASVDAVLLDAIGEAAEEESLLIERATGFKLDHGTTVPLYFLQHGGWRGPVVTLGYSFLPNEAHLRFGSCIRAGAERIGRRVAFVASADLSHRLARGAPAGYDPDAHRFDEEVVDAIRDGRPERIIEMDQALRRRAGECGYNSIVVALGVAEGRPRCAEVLHYEAPFGVGYLVAQIA
ncbi:MAG: AmmeMemoRadiSam system protein B [Luteitalea sp.]|nr:AmmeMemoRadiSam system protein B [Luteitalea sp.]